MQKRFIIEWMTCASCVVLIEKSLNDLSWVDKIWINLATNEAVVNFDDSEINFEEIKKETESNGFKIKEENCADIKIENNKKELNRFIYSLIFSLPIFSMMFMTITSEIILIIFAIITAIVVFIFWGHFHKSAYRSLLKLHFTMDSLVSLWTLTAFIYSSIAMFYWLGVYFEAAVAIITLINLWKYLEYKAKSKAWDAISKLLELQVKKANILDWKNIIEKDIDEIKLWDIIMVKAWEKIALDWIIVDWNASIDESMLTWESIPVYKEKGSVCYWSTLNLDWNVKVKVSKTSKNWVLSNIIKLVNEAQSSKAPIQKLADKISSIFVPLIILISVITFIFWFLSTWDMTKSIISTVATLVIACPCALWLATPTAIMVWTWIWAKNWMIIKNAETLEKTKDIDIIVFDKTWTLTNGKPEVIDIITYNIEEKDLIKYAKSLSTLSHHPLSKSIAKYWKQEVVSVNNFKEIKWKWIVWEIDDNEIFLWNRKIFSSEIINKQVEEQLLKLSKNGKTPILIGTKNKILGIIWLLDIAKIWVGVVINKLHSMNIEVIMLTGDLKQTAEYIWKQIGVDNIISEVMPEDKINTIKKLQSGWKKVAFVWDGINDAAALVQSDLAIAMWTGSDIAIESSDIVLVKGNISKVVSSIDLSRETLKTIKQNLFWAFVYNSIWIPLAAFWLLNPMFAAFAMSMSSVSVITNSLRLRRKFR